MRLSVSRLPWIVFGAGALVLLWGWRLDVTGTTLYVPNPPFLWSSDRRADGLALVAVAVLAAAVWSGPRLLAVGPLAFAAAVTGLTGAVRLAGSAARAGTGGWDRVFDPERSFEAANEYLPALPATRYGVDLFLDRWSEVVTSLPVHAAGHPPGLLLVMDTVAVDTPARLAALCIAAGILASPLLHLLGRRVLEEDAARIAALLLALSPGATMFGVTSADGLYMTLGVLAAVGLLARPRALAAVAGGLGLAVASFFAWSLLAVGAWAALVRVGREGLRTGVALAAAWGIALLAAYAALHALSGFDPIGTLRGTEQVYRTGIAQGRPYWFWVVGSPVAFLFTVGLPITWYATRGLAAGQSLAAAIFAVVVVASVLGFTKAETERIWLFFAPLLCLAAATMLPRTRLRWVLGLLAAQLLASELLFDSVW